MISYKILSKLLTFLPKSISTRYGMPKADIATISPLLLVTGLILPALVSNRFVFFIIHHLLNRSHKFVTPYLFLLISSELISSPRVSSNPMEMFIQYGMPLKLITSSLTWLVFQFAITNYADGATPGTPFFISLIIVMFLHEIAGTLIFVSLMAFFNKVSLRDMCN